MQQQQNKRSPGNSNHIEILVRCFTTQTGNGKTVTFSTPRPRQTLASYLSSYATYCFHSTFETTCCWCALQRRLTMRKKCWLSTPTTCRSEERRVGKEGVSP